MTQIAPIPVLVVGVDGDLDLATAPRLRELLDEALLLRPQVLRIDLSRCSFLDAHSLQQLLSVHRRGLWVGTRVVLCGLSPRLERVLALTRLHDVFDVEVRV